MRNLVEGQTWEGLLEGRTRRFVVVRIADDGASMQVRFADPHSEETLLTPFFIHGGQWRQVEQYSSRQARKLAP